MNFLARALLAFALCCTPAQAWWQSVAQQSIVAADGPISFIAGVTTASTNGTSVTSAAIDSTGANLLVVVVSEFAAAAENLTDNKSNIWNARTAYSSAGTLVQVYWSTPTSVGSGHTVSHTGTVPAVGFAAFSNANATPYDTEVGTGGNSGTPTAGSITPSGNDALIISGVSFFGNDATPASVNSGFTIIGTHIERTVNNFGIDMAYLIQPTAAAVSPVWTEPVASLWSATNTAFKH